MIHVRDAALSDLNVLIELGSRMLMESVESFPLIEPERVQKQLEMAVSMPDVFLVSLAEDNGQSVGMVTAVAGDYAFSSQRRAVSDLLFVLPERRGMMAAKLLVQRFLEWSSEIGASTAIIGISTGVFPERTGRFLELLGFHQLGMMYRREL